MKGEVIRALLPLRTDLIADAQPFGFPDTAAPAVETQIGNMLDGLCAKTIVGSPSGGRRR